MKNKIYMCGECYFSKKLASFLEKNTNYSIDNLSVGSGNMDTFLTILKYKKIFDPGLFLLGGSIHDKWGWNKGETLEQVYNWFKTSLYESTMTICLTGPYKKTKDELYDHRETNAYKEKFAAGHGIPILDLRILDENIASDGFHFSEAGEQVLFEKILNYIQSYVPKKTNPEFFKIEQKTDQLSCPECSRLTLIHDHNDELLDIYNNEKIVKRLVPLKLYHLYPEKSFFIDRDIVTNIRNIQKGLMKFTQPVFVKAMIVHK
jgi:hypothetical protein